MRRLFALILLLFSSVAIGGVAAPAVMASPPACAARPASAPPGGCTPASAGQAADAGAPRLAVGATVRVGSSPTGIAVDAATSMIYVANSGDNTVSIIDGATNSVSSTIPGFSAPVAVAANATTNTIYVANDSTTGTVSAIDGANPSATPTTVPVGANPAGIAVDAATNTIYVANSGGGTVSVINGANLSAAPGTVTVGSGPSAVAVDAATSMIYVANSGDSTVSVINGAVNPPTVSATIPLGGSKGPSGLAVDAATDVIYVANIDDNSISVINGAAAPPAVSALLPLPLELSSAFGGGPISVAVDEGPNVGYVADSGDSNVSVIDGSEPSVITSFLTDSRHGGVVVDPHTHTVYVVNVDAGTVSVIAGLGPPEAPADVTAAAGNSSATVTWHAPSANGGRPVRSYSIAANPPTVPPVYVDGTATEALVPDLTNGNAYTFTVTAINDYGAGPASAPSNSVTPAALPDAAASGIAVSPPSVPADHRTAAAVTVTLRDALGNPVSGRTVTLTAAGGRSMIAVLNGTTNSQGQAAFSVRDGTAETVTYTAKDPADGVTVSQTASVSFTASCSGCGVALQPSGGRASPGGSVTATVQAQAPAQGLANWTIDVTYDPTVLQPTGCLSSNSACATGFAPGIVQVSGSGAALQGSRPLAQITFSSFGPVATSSEVRAQALSFSDPSGVPYAANPGSLLVVVGEQGDVNLDGSVTSVDALCVLRLIAQLPETNACPVTAATTVMADVNQDGQLTSVDALCALRIVAGLPSTAACPILPVSGAASNLSLASAGGGRLSLPARGGENTANGAAGSGLSAAAASSALPYLGKAAGGIGNAVLSLTASTVASRSGRRSLVAVTFHASRPLGAWTVDVRYDPKAETVVTCEAMNGGACNPSFGAGTVRITGASAAGLSGMQTLAEITFEPTGHAKATSPLTLVATTLTDPAGIAMAVAGVTPADASPTPTTPPSRTSGSGAGGP